MAYLEDLSVNSSIRETSGALNMGKRGSASKHQRPSGSWPRTRGVSCPVSGSISEIMPVS
jgi:hypothetical protein